MLQIRSQLLMKALVRIKLSISQQRSRKRHALKQINNSRLLLKGVNRKIRMKGIELIINKVYG
jgi:hypothetical protein